MLIVCFLSIHNLTQLFVPEKEKMAEETEH